MSALEEFFLQTFHWDISPQGIAVVFMVIFLLTFAIGLLIVRQIGKLDLRKPETPAEGPSDIGTVIDGSTLMLGDETLDYLAMTRTGKEQHLSPGQKVKILKRVGRAVYVEPLS